MLKNIILIVSILISIALSCCKNSNTGNQHAGTGNKQDSLIANLPVDSIYFIRCQINDTIFNIYDKEQLSDIINQLKESEIEYIKFGSFNSLSFFDIHSQELLKITFKGVYFKSKGIVYRLSRELFIPVPE